MYIAAAFNQRRQFQRIGGWLKRGNETEVPLLREILFRASAALIARARMEAVNDECARQFESRREELNLKDHQIVFWSPTFVEFLNEVSPFLTAIRVTQNQLLPLLQRTLPLKQSVPGSLNDGMKKLDRIGLPKPYQLILQKYWSHTGRLVKDYRDIDLHYQAIIRHSFIKFDGKPTLWVVLPDNPGSKKPKDFTFEKGRDALSFTRSAYEDLEEVIDSLGKEAGIDTQVIEQNLELAQLGKLEEGVEKTIAFMVEVPETGAGLVIGQTQERKISVRRLAAKTK